MRSAIGGWLINSRCRWQRRSSQSSHIDALASKQRVQSEDACDDRENSKNGQIGEQKEKDALHVAHQINRARGSALCSTWWTD